MAVFHDTEFHSIAEFASDGEAEAFAMGTGYIDRPFPPLTSAYVLPRCMGDIERFERPEAVDALRLALEERGRA